MYYGWRRRYVPVGARRKAAAREMQKLLKKGRRVSPVTIEGRTISRTFWGKAWCENLERYSDFSNRLPRGRTYLRNGSVLDLQIAPGEVRALVSGSRIYKVVVHVSALPRARWSSICDDCAGGIDSLVELLQGRFSTGVMERICRPKVGLFPAPAEIRFACSCPDWASMCKHIAAVLYGVGARFDAQPELLFQLRKVDAGDLIAKAGRGVPLSNKGPAADRVLAAEGLSELFGLEMAAGRDESVPRRKTPPAKSVGHRRGSDQATASRRPRHGTRTRTPAGKAKAPVKPGRTSKKPSRPKNAKVTTGAKKKRDHRGS